MIFVRGHNVVSLKSKQEWIPAFAGMRIKVGGYPVKLGMTR